MNTFTTVLGAIQEDCQRLSNYYYEPNKKQEDFQRVILSVARCVGELMVGMGAYGVWSALPIIGNNSIASLMKSAIITWCGYEVFMLTTNYGNYHKEYHNAQTPITSHSEAGWNFLSFMRNNKKKAIDVSKKGSRISIYQEYSHGYTKNDIDEFVQGSFIPFALRLLFKERAEA